MGLAGEYNVVYPADYNGDVPLEDDVPILLVFGVPFPADYVKKYIEPEALPKLMNEYVKGYLTACEHCGETPCRMLWEETDEIFEENDISLLGKFNISWAADDDGDGPLCTRSEALKLCTAEDLKAARFKMYQRFCSMINGVLGKRKRVELPDCVTNKIKANYPDPNEEYVGFCAAPVDDNGH
jgi:hypothetical protein